MSIGSSMHRQSMASRLWIEPAMSFSDDTVSLETVLSSHSDLIAVIILCCRHLAIEANVLYEVSR
jgi:hypothetical protein